MFITGRLSKSDGGDEVIINVRHISMIEPLDGEDKCITFAAGKRVTLDGKFSKWKKLLQATNIEQAGII